MESASNATLAGSGPNSTGPSAAAQVVTLRHNTNNPTGTTMVARTPAITATFSLTNQQYTGLTSAQGYPASTGGNAVFFGGGVSPPTGGTGQPSSNPNYTNLGGVGAPQATYFTSVNPTAGQGISLTANAGVYLSTSTKAIALRAPVPPTTSRVRMADLEINFNVPVDNPILHVAGMGGEVSAYASGQNLGIATEFELLSAGTLTRLSGNTALVVSGVGISSSATNPSASCAANVAACGSVRVNGTGISSVRLRIFMRGDGTNNASSTTSSWAGFGTSFDSDAVIVGVSLPEPAPSVTVRKLSTGGTGTFNFTGTNGYTATAVTTTAAGTAMDGTTRTLSAASTATTITEAATAGYRLTDISCTGLGSGGTATPTYTNSATVAGSVLLNAAATALGSNIQCTFTNERISLIRLQKALPDGRAQSGDQFVLAMSGAGAPVSVTTTGTGTTATGTLTHASATAGAVYTLSESGAGTTVLAQYTTTYACTNARAGGQTPSGSGTSFSVTPAAGDDLTCTFSNTVAPLPNFGACPVGMYLSQGPTNTTNTTLYGISTITNPFTYPAIGQGATVYNAIGFNPVDNYLYGISFVSGTGNRLIRVGSDGATRDLGPVSGLATDNWVNGTFSNTGTLYVLAGDGSNALRAINVATNTATSIALSSSVEAADFAWIGGLIYAVQADGQLRAINPANGQVTNIGAPTAATVYGAVFGSPSGLFAVANDGSGFYSFDLTTGARTLISSAPGATVNDGASCPTAPIQFSADLSVTKTNTPAQGADDLPDDTYLPGEVRTYRIVVSNLGPFGVQNASVSDPVPAGIGAATMSWTCASTSGGAACGATSGTGALNDTGLDLPSGAVATYTLTMTVPASFTGNLTNTVTVTPPNNINDTNPANNTATDADVLSGTDVVITKTSTAATASSGQTVQFTLLVNNAGAAAANGTEVHDPAVAGLACTTVSCTGAAGATCPASPTVAGLQTSPGLAIPVLPAGSSVSLLLTCTVTATGF